jgi:hypothetical protein
MVQRRPSNPPKPYGSKSSDVTLADIGFDRHGAEVKQSVKKVQPDFDFTKDDD